MLSRINQMQAAAQIAQKENSRREKKLAAKKITNKTLQVNANISSEEVVLSSRKDNDRRNIDV